MSSSETVYVVDADFLSSFIMVGEMDKVYELIPGNLIMLDEVYRELNERQFWRAAIRRELRGRKIKRENTPLELAMEIGRIKSKHPVDSGEAEVLAYCSIAPDERVVCSNNCSQISGYCREYNLAVHTTSMHLILLLDSGKVPEVELDRIWTAMIQAGRRMPFPTFGKAVKERATVFRI